MPRCIAAVLACACGSSRCTIQHTQRPWLNMPVCPACLMVGSVLAGKRCCLQETSAVTAATGQHGDMCCAQPFGWTQRLFVCCWCQCVGDLCFCMICFGWLILTAEPVLSVQLSSCAGVFWGAAAFVRSPPVVLCEGQKHCVYCNCASNSSARPRQPFLWMLGFECERNHVAHRICWLL